MRALSYFQASRCEHATTPRCACRCRGTLHGKDRVPDEADRAPCVSLEDFESLPEGDPHRIRKPGERPDTREEQVQESGLFPSVEDQVIE